MPINTKYQAIFKHGCYYHLFNRSVSGINLFSNSGNYAFFLQKFSQYLSGIVQVYAWCLLPNHFHFLISVKEKDLCDFTAKEQEKLECGLMDINDIVIRRCKNFFLSYSHSYKRQQQINTNIFAQHFKRSEIDKDVYFSKVIQYIHLNPLHHKVALGWENYQWSSYTRIVANVASLLRTQDVLDWFGGLDGFIKYHRMQETEYLFDER